MAYPDKKALLNWANNYPKLWNAGDKQAWVDNWRSVATGEFRMLAGPQVQYSLETYQFGADGSVNIRTYYRVPAHNNKNLGDIFQQYLPENDKGL